MVKKGGAAGQIVADVIGTGVSMGTSYYAYKNSDSYAGFLWLRLKYGLIFLGFVIAIIGIPILLFYLFSTKSPIHNKDPQSPTSYGPGQPSK